MVIHGVRWKDYVILREALEIPGLRMTYCEGVLEIMSPSRLHEMWKKNIARFIETCAYERELPLFLYGSTTSRSEAKGRGAEPDECYCVGRQMRDGEFPDIVLEVIYESPVLDKLHVYKGFAVPEVWLFDNGVFRLNRLDGEKYTPISRSVLLPDLDFDLIARFAVREDQDVALRELRRLLRG